jgi:hypothetical protein
MAVEAYNTVNTYDLSQLVGDFARVHMFLQIFDGDPDKWIDFLNREGTEEEKKNDLPFANAIKYRASIDPKVLPRLRALVAEFSTLVKIAS